MQTSSIKRICSSSWPSSASPLVSISGNRLRMVSAVMGTLRVWVSMVVTDMVGGIDEVGEVRSASRVVDRGFGRKLYWKELRFPNKSTIRVNTAAI